MKNILRLFLLPLLVFGLSACGGSEVADQPTDPLDKQLNQILAAKVPFALSKSEAPVLNTHDWDSIFGGAPGNELKYDRYGEIDELVFVAPPKTLFNLKRQIRKVTRQGDETIYYKVTTPIYNGSEPLWVDGRFLDVTDVKPAFQVEPASAAKTLTNLRSFEGQRYTWRGSSATGVPELLLYYPPSEPISERMQDDWALKGFNSMGLLFRASNGSTPLDVNQLVRFGRPVYENFDDLKGEEDDSVIDKKARALMGILKPLDVIQFGERVMIVLDRDQVMEAKYESKYAGKAVVSNLVDTAYGLLTKGEFMEDPLQELTNRTKKKFFIRRYADTSDILEGEDLEDTENPEDAAVTTDEPGVEAEASESVSAGAEADASEDFGN